MSLQQSQGVCKEKKNLLIDYAYLDAFTDEPFKGNPAAVCYLLSPKDARWMQQVAAEFNLSQTAFLVRRSAHGGGGEELLLQGNENAAGRDEDSHEMKSAAALNCTANLRVSSSPNNKEVEKLHHAASATADLEKVSEYDLRWFTPAAEVDLCGHATLATAHLLYASDVVKGTVIHFHTKSGILPVHKVLGADGEWEGKVELNFPITVTSSCSPSLLLPLTKTLRNVDVIFMGKSAAGHLLVELSSADHVKGLEVWSDEVVTSDCFGLIITAKDSHYDFVSRFFCPKLLINEDPVCGSAHCALAPYWAAKLGKQQLRAYQASKRGGVLDLKVDMEARRVYIQGGAVLVMAGVFVDTF
jgi:PhzF family phenazine biosynthesis protein